MFNNNEPALAYHVYTEGFSGARSTVGYFRRLEDAKQIQLEIMEDLFPGDFKVSDNNLRLFHYNIKPEGTIAVLMKLKFNKYNFPI